MASPILSYRPEIKILIVSNDISKHLGDVGSVQLRKNINEPAGHYQIICPDLPFEGERESLYGLIRVMDPIQIWIRRWVDGNSSIDPWVPVLTGFVRSVGRDETVGGDGRVQRRVVIAGQDCGAVFQMEQLSPFITWQNKGVATQGAAILQWLQEYGLTSKPKKVEDFIWEVAYETTKDIMAKAGFDFQKEFKVKKGSVLPNLSYTQEGCIWDFIKQYSDAPWNELFVRENRKLGQDFNPELVFRPTPWFDKNDGPLPDFDGEITLWTIPMSDVVAMSAHRDDSELVNHVWVSHPMGMAVAMPQIVTDPDSGIVNGDTRAKFGDRIQSSLRTNLDPADIMHPISLPREEQLTAERKVKDWVKDRRDWAKIAHADLHEFERGSVTVKGYPFVRVGDYFRLERGDIIWEGYIVSVSHQYQAYRQYLVTLEYIRGNQFWRRKEVQQPWDKERKQAIA